MASSDAGPDPAALPAPPSLASADLAPSAAARPPCLQCRARKVRCDRAPDCCGGCRRLGYSCSFGGVTQPSQDDDDPRDTDEITQAGTRRRRARAACDQCRAVKARCTGGVPCLRCRSRGRDCSRTTRPSRRPPPSPAGAAGLGFSPSPRDADSLPCGRDAEREHIQAYFDATNPTACVFLHRPTVLTRWSQGTLDPSLLKALCAMGQRLRGPAHHHAVARAWIREAWASVLARLDRVSVTQLQTLVLVVQFSLQEGDTVEAWNALALAARFAFTLRLNYERPHLDPVARECQRRLMWAVYLLDRLFSSGIDDLAVCPVSALRIRLPCDDRSFDRGTPSRAAYFGPPAGPSADGGDVDVLGHLIRLYDCRHRILGHTKSVRREGASPAASTDRLAALQEELDRFALSLPAYLQLRPGRLATAMHSTDAYGFLLLQTLWLQCHCDLYRFLIPGIRECVSQAAFSATPPDYVHFCQSRCLDKATQLCDLWSDVSRLRPALVIDDHLFDVSVYQVTQVVHHLRHLLPAAEDDPHSLGRLQRKLRRAVQMASASHSGARRSTEALRTAASLLDVLGEGEVATVTRTTASDGNLQHLPSHGSLISTILDGAENPDENEHDGNNENDGIGKERGASSSAAASIGIAEHTRFAYPATTTYLSPSSSSSHLRRASGSTQPGPEETAWALGGLGFPSWDLLDIELNSLYGQAFDTPALSGG